MKIAVSATGRTREDALEPRFGRAPWFVIHDEATGEWDALDNRNNAELPQSAGIQTAQALAGMGVEAIIAGQVGPKAMEALNRGGVTIRYSQSRTVAQAVKALQDGELSGPDPQQPKEGGNMPGYDGTGPRGEGAMTGGGFGPCGAGRGMGMGRGMGAGRGIAGGGRGMGGGGGRGMGGGRGFGRGMGMSAPTGIQSQAPVNEEQELRDRLARLEQEAADIKARLNRS